MKTRCSGGALALAVLVRACAFSLAAPAETAPAPEAPPEAHDSHGPLHFSVSWSAPERVVAPLQMRNGLPTIPCSINGHLVRLILDTGSQECVLEAKTAGEAGVRTIAQPGSQVEVTGARGKEFARVGVPDGVSIGAWHWQGLPCIVRNSHGEAPRSSVFSGPPIAFDILGMSALQEMCSYVTIDYRRHEAIFGFRQSFHPEASAGTTHQPFELRHGVPFAQVASAGQEWAALLDTGASSKLEINPSTAQRFGWGSHFRWLSVTHLGLGDSNDAPDRKFPFVMLGNVACLGRDWPNVEAICVDSESKIGSGMFRAFRLTLDFAASQIWLETPGSRHQ